MADSFGKLVVRSYAPKRRVIGVSLIGVSGLLLLYGAFELGRYDAHFRVIDSLRGALSTSARIRALEAENGQQRTDLEAAEVARRVDREGYKQVEQSLGDMQSQIARLNQDLAFYRGLVQPDSIVTVKAQQVQIVPEAAPGRFRLKFVLLQAGKPTAAVNGTFTITLDGLQQNKPVSLDLTHVSPNARPSLAYSFKYFQDYEVPLQLPAGFEPTRVGVEIYSGKRDSHGSRQAFVWKAQGMSVETDATNGTQPKGIADVQTETE